MENKDIIKVYCSHTIRGKHGDKATKDVIAYNCEKAHKLAETLRKYLFEWSKYNGYADVELYVPAEHDEFPQIAYDLGYISIDDILDVDCEIVSRSDLLLVFGNEISAGMAREIEHAAKIGMPLFSFTRLSKSVINNLTKILYNIHYNKG